MKLLCLTVVFICVSGHVTADPDTLFFSPQPEDVTAMEGSNATLRCDASKKQNVTFYWTQDGDRIENDTRRYMIGSNLYINRVSPLFDLGEFKCIATNTTSGRSIVSRGAQINILWITDTVRVVSTTEPDLGGELVLRCKAEGNPETQITWFKNGNRIYRDERISFKNNHMHISDISLKDNGVYSCQAINDVGAVNSTEIFALRMSDDKSPHILTIPHSVIAPENTSVQFDCVYENAASIEWYFGDDDKLENSTRHIIYKNDTLEILSAGSSDVGYYRCKGVSLFPTESPDQEYAALLQLAYLEEFSEDSFEPWLKDVENVVVTVHNSYDITCLPLNGLPRPKMWWEDPKGHVINDSGRIHVEDMRLIFTEVQESDAGDYSCMAENSIGQRLLSFSLVVSVPPVVIKHPVDIMVNEGENAIFECGYNNTSSASVSWLKDDTYLKDTGNHIIISEENGTLLIRSVGSSDSGSYHCEVHTEEFSSVHSKKASLSVKEKLKFIPAPVNRKLELGSNAKIYCKAGGSTPPVVKWTKIDARSSEWPPHIRDDNGTLHFNRVLSTDTGKYMCVATSSQGIINATIDVDVIVMPKFSVQPADTVANEGDPVILHCLAEGDPTPIIQWDRNNELNGFNPQRFKVLENGSLYASEIHADDEGKYGCTAGNSGGLRRHEVSLTVNAREFNTNRIGRGGGFGNEGENTMTKTVAITLGAAGVYIILVVGLMMWCRYRRARRKALMLAQATVDAENSEIIHDMELKDRTPHKNCLNENATNEENCGLIKSSTFSKLQFPRENLATVMLLGHGEYGEVFLAKATGLKDNSETVVMVKALESKEEHIISDFKRELSMYIKMKHENVGTVLRVCQDVDPHYMIMDYTDWGDLKQFLLATRPEEVTKSPKQSPLSIPQNLMICQQVAVGMEFISKQQFVHKDLATRNCLISSNLKIKISCPCLSMDTYSQEYYHSKSRVIPVRWAPVEAAIGDNWSTKSDVWAFAVLVWEVFYKAELPFLEMSNEEVIQKLQEGELKHSAPENAPDSLVKLLMKCWSPNTSDRPSFSEVVAVFVELSVAVQV